MAFNQDGNPHVKDGKPVARLRFPGDGSEGEDQQRHRTVELRQDSVPRQSRATSTLRLTRSAISSPEKTFTGEDDPRLVKLLADRRSLRHAAGLRRGRRRWSTVAASDDEHEETEHVGWRRFGPPLAQATAAAAAATATRKKTVAPKVHSHDDLVAVRRKGERSIAGGRRSVASFRRLRLLRRVRRSRRSRTTRRLDFDAQLAAEEDQVDAGGWTIWCCVSASTGGDEAALCCGYTELGSVKEGLQAGKRVIMPLSAKGVVTLAQNGPLLDEEKKRSSFIQ